MKKKLCIEYGEKKVMESDIINEVKRIWRDDNKLVKDIKTLDLYLKPEENKCYYVVNNQDKGFLGL